jgi:hypothetical protein
MHWNDILYVTAHGAPITGRHAVAAHCVGELFAELVRSRGIALRLQINEFLAEFGSGGARHVELRNNMQPSEVSVPCGSKPRRNLHADGRSLIVIDVNKQAGVGHQNSFRGNESLIKC